MSADRSSSERIRRLKALSAASGPATRSRDYDTWQTVQFGKTPYLRLSATGVVVEEKCCSGSGSDPDQSCGWTPANAGNFVNVLGGVAYGNNRWIAVGEGSNGKGSNGKNIQYSDDGINWQESSGTPFGIGLGGCGVAYGNNRWVAVGKSLNGKNILFSNDGDIWQESSGLPFGSGVGFGVAYGNNRWVAVGHGSNGKDILFSDDGDIWQESSGATFGIGFGGCGVAYGNNRWVAVGFGSNGKNILFSDDGKIWQEASGTQITCLGVAYGNNRWVAVGVGAAGQNILFSVDGENWQESSGATFGGKPGRGIVYANNLWVAVSGYPLASSGGFNFPPGPNILYSTDNGLTWLESPGKNFSGISSLAGGIAYGNNRWVATGAGFNSSSLPVPPSILYTSDPTAAC